MKQEFCIHLVMQDLIILSLIDGGFKQVEKLGFNKKYVPTTDRIDVSDVVRSEATQNEKAIYTDELLSKIGNTDVQIIDTRLEVEYNGRVIYGENKAGSYSWWQFLYRLIR